MSFIQSRLTRHGTAGVGLLAAVVLTIAIFFSSTTDAQVTKPASDHSTIDRSVASISAKKVVLGSGDASSGLGTVRPRRIWLGGGASTIFFNLKWKGWGRGTAKATGRGYDEPPYEKSVRAKVTAYKIGTCDGIRAYRYIKTSVETKSGWRRSSRIAVC